jgi:hypothetical protein
MLKGYRETANLIVRIRWGAGCKHQNITAQSSGIGSRQFQERIEKE